MSNNILKWGLRFGGGLIAFGLLYRVAGLQRVPGLVYLFYLAIPIASFFALKNMSVAVRWKNGLGVSIVTAAVAACTYAVFVFAYNQFIDDSLIQQARDSGIAAWEAAGLPAEEVELRSASPIFTPFGFAAYIFLLMSLVGAVFSPALVFFRRRSSVDEENNPPPAE
jgi:hypothetical protein